MRALPIIAVMALSLPIVALAVEPNLQPGEWEYRNTMSFEGAMEMPERTHTYRQCVTLDDVRSGEAFTEDTGECTMSDMDMRSDGMRYTMQCRGPDGTRMDMNADMQFAGDRARGTMRADMQSAAGAMTMRMVIEGRRVGGC